MLTLKLIEYSGILGADVREPSAQASSFHLVLKPLPVSVKNTPVSYLVQFSSLECRVVEHKLITESLAFIQPGVLMKKLSLLVHQILALHLKRKVISCLRSLTRLSSNWCAILRKEFHQPSKLREVSSIQQFLK